MAGTPRIYLDSAATTPPAPAVVEAVREALTDSWGNASSAHAAGSRARRIVEEARVKVAALLGGRPDEIVFTSGATEANNTVFVGLAGPRGRPGRIVISAIEHPCVIESAAALERSGWTVVRAGVDETGIVDPDAVGAALGKRTALVSVMLANNEVGTIEPVAEIAKIAKAAGAFVHTDATQAVGRIPVDVGALGVDYLSLSAHKFNGPKGVGALWVRRGAAIAPLFRGGSQEGGRRAGTLNVPGIAGLGVAAELAKKNLAETADLVRGLRDRLEAGIRSGVQGLRLNGHPVLRLPSHLNMSFDLIEGEALMMRLDLAGIAVSTGSACSSGSREPSYVLTAMGCDAVRAAGAVRFSVGSTTTEAEIDRVIGVLPGIVADLRKAPPAFLKG
ncbi:MAG: cysteine desulfurase family protein [Candidatus Coatesbacteria bacterium]